MACRNLLRYSLVMLVVGASGIVPAKASPAPTAAQVKEACVASYKSGQIHRKNGELISARDDFRVCAAARCSAVLRRDCVPWLAQVDQAIPTIVVAVHDEASVVIPNPRVIIDGDPTIKGTAQGAIQLDPGKHVIRVEVADREAVEQSVQLREGEKETFTIMVRAAVPTATTTADPRSSEARPVPTSTIALTVLGLAGVGAFAGFGLHGNAQKSELETCKPYCDPDRVDGVKRDYIIANASLGLGVVFLGLATYTFVTRPTVEPKAAAFHLDLAPSQTMFRVSGSF